MTKDQGHIDRNRLIKLIRENAVDSEPHLKRCTECREAAELLQEFVVAGAIPLPDAPSGWIAKAKALVSSESIGAKVSSFVARLVFDSWASPSPVGVRGMETTSDRRIRFKSEGLSLDLRAEQRAKEWAFIAQLRHEDDEAVSLVADGTEVAANDYGLFEWTASKPTRHLKILLGDKEIEIPELKWKRPMST